MPFSRPRPPADDLGCFRSRYSGHLFAVPFAASFDYYMANGSRMGWAWGCDMQTHGFDSIAPAPAPAGDDGETCRRTGCCIFVVEMSPGSTARHVQPVLAPSGFPHRSDGRGIENQAQYTAEFFVHLAVRGSLHRTWNVSSADYFYVASYDTLMRYESGVSGKGFNLHDPSPRYVQDLRHIVNSAAWRAHNGANFVFTSAHPLGLTNLPEPSGPPMGTFVVLKVDGGRGVIGMREVVIPHVTALDSIAFAAREARRTGRRRWLIMFLGSCQRMLRGTLLRDFDALPPNETRGELLIHSNLGSKRSGGRCTREPIPKKYEMHSTYVDAAANSEFCLVIPGDTPSSRREVETTLTGCIPLLVARGGAGQDPLPYANAVAWDAFSLCFPPNISARELLNAVRGLPVARREAMRAAIWREAPKLQLGPSPGSRGGQLAIDGICRGARHKGHRRFEPAGHAGTCRRVRGDSVRI